MQQIVYTPEIISLAIISYLSGHNHTVVDLNDLCVFILKVINEVRSCQLDTGGVVISKTLYVPFEIMPREILENLTSTLRKPIQMNATQPQNIIGPSLVLCSLLLVLQQIYIDQITHISCIFDVILQTVLRECRVNTVQLLKDVLVYGYHQDSTCIFQNTIQQNSKKARISELKATQV